MGLLATILTALFINTSLAACVTVDTSTGTYTVDEQGAVRER